jgi:dipeptidyl aminopeptidase/acylaminoacyl peptidase
MTNSVIPSAARDLHVSKGITISLAAPLLACALLCSPSPALAQSSPSLTINEDVTVFSFAPDGRLAYAVRRVFSERKLEIQRDDIWVTSPDGKKSRIIEGPKMFRGPVPFSYSVQSLRWSPDGTRLAVEMFTSVMTDQRGETREGLATWLLDAAGKEIKVGGGSALIDGASNAAWLPDGATLAFLHEAVQPRLLFSIRTVKPLSGGGAGLFSNSSFSSVAWDLRPGAANTAVAVERDPSLSGPIRLVRLDLQKEQRRELAQLDGFLGQLSLSPSAKRVAYFTDGETLEIRDLEQPQKLLRLHVAYGTFVWSADERRVLIKRGMFDAGARASGRKSGTLAWVMVPLPEGRLAPSSAKGVQEAELRPALSDLLYQNFAISPDGRWLAVTAPGGRPLQLFPVN